MKMLEVIGVAGERMLIPVDDITLVTEHSRKWGGYCL